MTPTTNHEDECIEPTTNHEDECIEPTTTLPELRMNSTSSAVGDTSVWKPAMDKCEEKIRKGDQFSIMYRWNSGVVLLGAKGRKQLGKGVLDILAHEFGVSRSELTARMKFAKKFRTEEQVTNVISRCKTWFNIRQHALTDKPRDKKPKLSKLGRLLKSLRDYETHYLYRFEEDDVIALQEIEACAQSCQNDILRTKHERSARVAAQEAQARRNDLEELRTIMPTTVMEAGEM